MRKLLATIVCIALFCTVTPAEGHEEGMSDDVLTAVNPSALGGEKPPAWAVGPQDLPPSRTPPPLATTTTPRLLPQSSVGWRVVEVGSPSDVFWCTNRLKFINAVGDEVNPSSDPTCEVVTSTEPEVQLTADHLAVNAFADGVDQGCVTMNMRGRKYLGMICSSPHKVDKILLQQASEHFGSKGVVQALFQGVWTDVVQEVSLHQKTEEMIWHRS